VWRRRTPDTLLQTIARDQALYHDILTIGSTKAGLAVTRRWDVHHIWKKYHVTEAVAPRVYREYHAEMSALLGRWRRVSEKVRALCRAQGTEVPHMRPAPLMPDLAGRPIDEHGSIILHWFAHALRNLARYREGHAPMPWHPTVCRTHCLQVQRRVMA